jgi:hypothetical protein
VDHESLTDLSFVLPSHTLSTLTVVAPKDQLSSLSTRPAVPSTITSEGTLLGSCGGRLTAQANADTGAIWLSMSGNKMTRIFVIASSYILAGSVRKWSLAAGQLAALQPEQQVKGSMV